MNRPPVDLIPRKAHLAEALVRLGATRQEVEETLGMAVYMGGGPSLMYAADAISAFEQFQQQINVAAEGRNALPIQPTA